MPLSWEQMQANALAFARRWRDAASEEGQAQSFCLALLQVFGVAEPEKVGAFEYRVPLDDGHAGYIDYLWPGKIAIEMKSRGRNLDQAWRQLQEYIVRLPEAELPELLLVCDFERMVLRERTSGKKHTFRTAELGRNVRRFALLAGYETSRAHADQAQVNIRAAGKMARLHDALQARGHEGHALEVMLVRLLFCLFAEDTGIFPQDAFFDYVANSRPDGGDLAQRLALLFEVLDLPPDARARRPLLSPTLLQFCYVNGGLFAERLPQAEFDAGMRQTLLACCEFDWSAISPAIFGSMFQGVLAKKARRELGAHYTSEENILKLINPLFMDALWREFERVKHLPAQLERLHNKIAGLRFLDPACGCGNFLIVAYRELRLLELAILKMKVASGQAVLNLDMLLKVGVEQFCGIEQEEFPCQIAQVGMWLMDHQMNLRAAEEFGSYYARLPLTASARIVQANALRGDWLKLAGPLAYIMGNPPFSGARVMGPEQKADTLRLFQGCRNAGNLDYVACWFRKAVDVMLQSPATRCAFVATNSIAQGEQAALLWQPLFAAGFGIDFAWPAFRWSNDAPGMAGVHCVIVGFSLHAADDTPFICGPDGPRQAAHINAWLLPAPDVWLYSRQKPLCPVPEIGIGNKPIDGGHYLFSEAEKAAFLAVEPQAAPYFHPWMGAEEFINGKKRYCLWLGDLAPEELRNLPECRKRVEAVRNYRLASKSAPTRRLAETPRQFHVQNMPAGAYIAIPEVSSERRKYIPIGFLTAEILCSNKLKLMPNATFYHFGILTSSAHNAWLRTVGGRLKSDYSYSKDIVYNNFPWPAPEARAEIARLGEAVLAARARFPQSCLADLYDPLTMPPELLKAHKKLDAAVLKAYGLKAGAAEAEILAELFRRYGELTKQPYSG